MCSANFLGGPFILASENIQFSRVLLQCSGILKAWMRKAWPWSDGGLPHWAQLLIQSCGLCLWQTIEPFIFGTLYIISNWKVSVALVVITLATTITGLQLCDDLLFRGTFFFSASSSSPSITTILYCILTCAGPCAKCFIYIISFSLHNSLQDAVFLPIWQRGNWSPGKLSDALDSDPQTIRNNVKARVCIMKLQFQSVFHDSVPRHSRLCEEN